MERQALRRMDTGTLTEDQIERLGETFMKLDQRMRELTAHLRAGRGRSEPESRPARRPVVALHENHRARGYARNVLLHERSSTMASLKDVEKVADDLSSLVDQLRKEMQQGGSFDRLVQISDQISEHADEAAGTFSTVNEALMGRLNDLKGSQSGNRSSGSRAKARA